MTQLKINQSVGVRERLYWLDALRGAAALSVVLGHYFWGMLEFPGHTFFDPGLFGVAVFFLISGYIIPLSVKVERHAAWWFAQARFFRLYPLYWVSLLFGAVIYSPSILQCVVNTTMIQRFVGVDDVINVYWTLQIELLFYIIIIVSIWAGIFNRPSVIMSLVVIFATCSMLFAFIRLYYQVKFPLSVPIGLTCIFIGNLKSLADTGRISRRNLYAIALCATALLIGSFYLGYSQDWGHSERPERFVVSYALAAGLFMCFSRLRTIRFRFGFILGAISYPMYLIHQPILEMLHQFMPDLSLVSIRLLSVPLVLVVAYALHLGIEKPGVRLGRSFGAHRTASVATTNAPAQRWNQQATGKL